MFWLWQKASRYSCAPEHDFLLLNMIVCLSPDCDLSDLLSLFMLEVLL